MPRKGKGQKVQSAGGQTYGKRVEQEDRQRVVPLPEAPKIRPGEMGPLTRSSERPSEPLTAGTPLGPGPGPEVVARPGSGRPSEPLSERLAAYLPILESRAAQPDASANFRLFVRRVRLLAAKSPAVY